MKVAIVHDYIKEHGGAERVLESLHNVFPDAPIYTSVYLPSFLGPHRERFESMDIRTSFLQYLPFKSKLISPFRLVASLAFGRFDFSKYDVVIVSATGAYLPNSINKKNAVQICYCHTPSRYLYGYETARDWKKSYTSVVIGTIAIHILRMFDFKYSKNVDDYIANSEETRRRMQKFYRRDAAVIYPPVEIKNHESRIMNQGKGEYYLTGGRIARAKHTDLILEAFAKNGLPLKIFGKGFAGFEEELRKKFGKYKNIEFLGEVGDEEKDELMKGAKAFVFASEDEDFGIVPVEAMMAGTPVIAHRSGGVLETVIEGETGLFFDEFSVESLNNAIKKFETLRRAQGMFDSAKIKQHAQKFSKERFEREIKEFVNSKADS
ncbi:MAG: glycosyltransferase [Candidatus Levybacteria bacterium]|nr:glycosyltransferase [Candidatus Levybacteria bacterium]